MYSASSDARKDTVLATSCMNRDGEQISVCVAWTQRATYLWLGHTAEGGTGAQLFSGVGVIVSGCAGLQEI